MGQILIEFDNTLEQSEIIIPLIASSPDEAGSYYEDNKTEIQQTSVFGIMSPLIAINNIVIDFNDIINFSLKSIGPLPELTMTVFDKYQLISSIDAPGLDNEVRVQILPQFDEAYKKINLTFYISKMKISGSDIIEFRCLYKLPKLTETKYKSFGKIDTYNLIKNIAVETGLGFATNIAEAESDSRYIYCDYKSYIDLLNNEIDFSGHGQNNIYDYWIDYWNNINLVNIYDRYITIDKDDDMKIWISSQPGEINEGVKVQPTQTVATLNNHPLYNHSDLYVNDYNIVTNSANHTQAGSDRIYSIYESSKDEYIDYFIQDGDVKNDIFVNFEYLGENYGEYNYLIQKCFRSTFMQKINSEYMNLKLRTPLLSLMRGQKVNFISYINDSQIENKFNVLEDRGYIEGEPEVNIPIDDVPNTNVNVNEDNGHFSVDRQISGQYLITGSKIEYKNNNWEYTLIVNRPAAQKPSFINEEYKK